MPLVGDIHFDYKLALLAIENGIDKVGSVDKRFVVYNISYSKDSMGPSMVVFLSEVA